MNNYPGGGMDDQNQQFGGAPPTQDDNPYAQPAPSDPSASTENNPPALDTPPEPPAAPQPDPQPNTPISSNPYDNMPDEPKDEPSDDDGSLNINEDENSEDEGEISSPIFDDDLLNIKQEALQALSPLVSKLEQTPEEKFKTTMMMIQASDDQTLIQTAYETAKEITDDKARAQALLDVVNEINYFTQQKS